MSMNGSGYPNREKINDAAYPILIMPVKDGHFLCPCFLVIACALVFKKQMLTGRKIFHSFFRTAILLSVSLAFFAVS